MSAAIDRTEKNVYNINRKSVCPTQELWLAVERAAPLGFLVNK